MEREVRYCTSADGTRIGEDGASAFRAMAAFLNEDPEMRALPVTAEIGSASPDAFRTVLFTDLVGHTEMMSRLGDQGGRAVLRASAAAWSLATFQSMQTFRTPPFDR